MPYPNFSSKIPRASANTVTQILRQQLLWMLLLRIILFTLLIGVTYFISGNKYGISTLPVPVLVILILVIYTVTIFSAFLLPKSGQRLGTFGFIQCFFDGIFASAIVYFTGISHSIFPSVYFFSIIAGGLILPRKGGLIAAAAATLLYGSILLMELFGYVPDYFHYYNYNPITSIGELLNLFSVKGLTFFLAALLSANFGRRLTTTEEVLSNTIYSFDKLSHLYKMIFDNIPTGIITTNDQNLITSANNAACTITGLSLNDLIGKELNYIFPDFSQRAKVNRSAIDFEKRDGTKIRIGYSITSLHIPLANDSERRGNSLFEEDSKLITLQNISEIEKLEKKIRQGEKMAAIGMMSASIAHDFRNPLTAISGSAQVLAQDFESDQPISRADNLALTDIILRESNRLISTISDFLKFARPDVANRSWFSIFNCVEEVLQVCHADPNWPKSARIEVEIDPQTDIWADEKQIFTVIIHLIQNSLAFCPEGEERIAVHAFEKKFDDKTAGVKVTVDDNGPGIKESLLDKVFEPFFTSRTDGTGLGLAIVRQIIEAHKGTISISDSELGGTKFTINLPFN